LILSHFLFFIYHFNKKGDILVSLHLTLLRKFQEQKIFTFVPKELIKKFIFILEELIKILFLFQKNWEKPYFYFRKKGNFIFIRRITMKNSSFFYSVGALLYCPANNQSIVNSIIHQKFGTLFSLAFCLEDTINDNCVLEAEAELIHSIEQISLYSQQKEFFLPKIFIRVRNPEQIIKLTQALKNNISILCGFIIPKFSLENIEKYRQAIIKANEIATKKLYIMPIYESKSMIDLRSRYEILYKLKDKLSHIEDLVLNIRVGGNDLCHIFGFRRHQNESIHRIRPIANIFSDIITVYGMDYVISGPVWEYYNGIDWENGLINEIKDDQLCGFIGKTVIHPNQIPVINHCYQVSRTDYEDAQAILNWNVDQKTLVSGNTRKERMNEKKTHFHWAVQISYLAENFGIV